MKKHFFPSQYLSLWNFIILKDENMHPTFKTSWPFVNGWLFEIALDLHEDDAEEETIIDNAFVGGVAYNRKKRNMWLIYVEKLLNFFQ